MRNLWVAILSLAFILMLAGLPASAESTDSLAFSTDGVELSFVSNANSEYTYCPLTVTGSGKVTIYCQNGVAGLFGVKQTNGSFYAYYVLPLGAASPRSLYLHSGTYMVEVKTSGSQEVRLSAILDALPSDTEPNDAIAKAQYTLPASINGIIGRAWDNDQYTINVTERVGVTFIIESMNEEFYSSLILRNPSYAIVQDLAINPVVALDPGVYYLLMREAHGCPDTTAYTINASTFRCVDSLSIQPTEAKLEIGETITLKPTALPQDNDERIAFTSSVPSVATVTGDGVINALAAGTTTITCAVPSGASVDSVITVLKPTATRYKLPKTCKATRGFMYSMYGWLNYPSANRAPGDLKWKSSNGGVASITAEGILSCYKLGKVKITATNSKGKKFTTTLTVVSNQLKFNKPIVKKGYIGSYPKRVYYKGNSLNFEVFLYNHTKYNLRSSDYYFEVFDLAKSTSRPIIERYTYWHPGRIKKGTWKVFKISLDRSLYENYDLGLGQLYPVIYCGGFYIVKNARIQLGEPTLRKIGIVPHRADNTPDFM